MIAVLAHLLSGMKDALVKLEDALKDKDIEKAAMAKKEILNFQSQINNML